MDKDHHLDAPDNESLSTIEQLTDHSELTTLYPHVHKEWEGSDLMSHDDREKKRSDEKLRISLTIRKWFAVIGVLVPLPAVLAAFLLTVAAQFLTVSNAGVLLLPVFFGVALVGYATYRSIKYVYAIFYNHAIKATPFISILVGLLFLSLDGIFLATQPLHTGTYMIDSLIIGGAVLLASVLYSGILLLIWASPILSSRAKLGYVMLMVAIILGGTAVFYLT